MASSRVQNLQGLHLILIVVVISMAIVFPPCSAFTWGNCSTTCKSSFCKEAPLLRYGKYCGLFYTGCPGEAPCDGLDSCCMAHDHCVGNNKYLSVTCNQKLLDCVAAYRRSGAPQFPGNKCNIKKVEKTIKYAIKAGVWVGKGIGDGSSPAVK